MAAILQSDSASNTPLLTLDGASLQLRPAARPLLTDICLSLQSEDFAVLLGPRGSGKSSLLRLLAGLVPLQQGHLRWQGQLGVAVDGSAPLPWRSQVAWLPSRPQLLGMAAGEALEYPLRLRGIPSNQIQASIQAWRAILEIPSDWLGKTTAELGEAASQHIALARALITAPRLLLLDDPWPAETEPIPKPLALALGQGFSQGPSQGPSQGLAPGSCSPTAPAILWARRSPTPIPLATRLGRLDQGHLAQWEAATPQAWQSAQTALLRTQSLSEAVWEAEDFL